MKEIAFVFDDYIFLLAKLLQNFVFETCKKSSVSNFSDYFFRPESNYIQLVKGVKCLSVL